MNDGEYRKMLSAALPDLAIGDRLARGGQGLVFCAEDGDGCKFAVKVLFAATVDDADRFDREIAALKSLDHPHIVPILGNGVLLGAHGKVPYLVMPLARGNPIVEASCAATLRVEVRLSRKTRPRTLSAESTGLRLSGEAVKRSPMS